MPEIILSATNLCKRYDGTNVVNQVSFSINKGEFFGLLGPNGAGKTTTIGILTGLVPPTKGTVSIEGMDMAEKPLTVKSKIGFVPQDFAFYPTLNARDNLLFFGRIYGLQGKNLKQQIDKTLRMVGLSERAGDRVSTFSNGMKRRLNIAIGMLHDPNILILDEPTVGVDTHMRQAILGNLRRLNQNSLTILYTTHQMLKAQHLCHRVAIMDKGRIMAIQTPSALIANLGQGVVRICFEQAILPSQIEALAQVGPLTHKDPYVVHIKLSSSNADQIVKHIWHIAEQTQTPIASLSILKPSLETVFLDLTGRKIDPGG